MSVGDFIACLPGFYYYSTRYEWMFERIIHVLKYWLVFGILLSMLAGHDVRLHVPALLVVWLAFLNVYEIFCRQNDEESVVHEMLPVHRTWRAGVSEAVFVGCKILTGIVLLAVAAFLRGLSSALVLAGFLCGLSLCFLLHNRLKEAYRPVTHYLLYLSKGMVFLTVCFGCLDRPGLWTYLVFVLGFSFSYLPNYCLRKCGGRTRESLGPETIGLLRHLLVQPIVYKNVVLIGLLLRDVRLLAVIVWIDMLTLIEFGLRKRKERFV